MSAGRLAAALLCLCLLLSPAARAETRLYTFPYDDVPQALLEATMRVADEGPVTVVMTFAGDCTLGADAQNRAGRNTFPRVIAREGYAYPFANLRAVFDADDMTVVNLEGVLSDSEAGRVKKKFNFRGESAYAAILTLGGVECVSLANNHILDYGPRGKADTTAALDAAGIAYFDDSIVTVLEKDGVFIGFTGSAFAPDRARFREQVAALRALGCAAVVHAMHAGAEYAPVSRGQINAAAFLAENGASLIVGHHPHIVQEIGTVSGVPVAFSLGNCVFGGNVDPRDYDAALLRVEMTFSNGALTDTRLRAIPIRVSGSGSRNDFQPALLTGADAERVLAKMGLTGEGQDQQ